MRHYAVLLVGTPAVDHLKTGNLLAVLHVEEHVEHRVLGAQLLDGTQRKDAAHTAHEGLPLPAAVEIVEHDEASAQEVLADTLNLRIRQIPVPRLDHVKERVVEELRLVRVNVRLLGPRVDGGEPPQALQEMALRFGRIDLPGPPLQVLQVRV